MSPRLSAGLALLFALLAAGAIGWGFQQSPRPEDGDFQARRIALLESEVDRLRGLLAHSERLTAAAGNDSKRRAIEKVVEDIRGLEFLEPVQYQMLGRADIRGMLHEKLAEQYSEEEFDNIAVSLAALGLLEPGYPLREKYIDLLSEQVAAFFDQHTHTLYMFEDAPLDDAQNRIILAHELMHALQDQHFSLLELPLEIKDNDDRAFAASALVEGEATLVMTEFLLRNLSWSTLRDSLAGMMVQNMEQLQTAPVFLREMLLFPYLRGQEFAMFLQAHGGYDALTEAYENPPASTAQILHPELFLAESRVDPVRVEWDDTALDGAAPIADNVLGEMGTRILLSNAMDKPVAEAAAAGWAGDRYLVFGGEDNWQLVWKTLWRSTGEAEKFLLALEKWLAARHPAGTSRAAHIMRDGTTVTLIDAPDARAADALAGKFL